MGGCGGLERTEFLTVSTLGEGCGGPERSDFLTVDTTVPLEGVMVLKEQNLLIF